MVYKCPILISIMGSNFHKTILAKRADELSLSMLRAAAERAKKELNFDELMGRGRFKIVILADNVAGRPADFVLELQSAIREQGFPCNSGSNFHEKMEDCFDENVEEEIGKNDLILLINGTNPGLIDESKLIRKTPELKKKTLFFFAYSNEDQLLEYASKKMFPIDFKYPVPYKYQTELKAKVLFGVLHWYYYKYRLQDLQKKEGG